MDFNKIFIKDACPTKIGGQAVLEGIMMKGEDRTAVAVRLPDDSIYIKTQKLKARGKWFKVPIVRGVLIFVDSLVTGMKTLMLSAELLTEYDEEADDEEAQTMDASASTAEPETKPAEAADAVPTKKDKQKSSSTGMTISLILSVAIAILFTIGIFVIAPTWVVNLLDPWVKSEILKNLIEGVFRILLFVLYVLLISRMKDIQTVFQFHGAEHECIHCFEGGLDLTPANCQQFETLHPRCGTSFLMFVMVIALLLFSLLGWPDLLFRIGSRLVLIPVIAGLSYELLRWAGSSTSPVVKILSVPGLLLQKLTTMKPNDKQLEVAIASMKAVLVPAEAPVIDGLCDLNGELIPEEEVLSDEEAAEKATIDAGGGI
ncbi:MAG: DUF1385 domain-containing protein [Clostridiales Family XIII bacterium]|jgi:uncharacterized protein YqhQ|nr:DUF1385 domain-containing protein [Clostridiales Family XIII bacterium]